MHVRKKHITLVDVIDVSVALWSSGWCGVESGQAHDTSSSWAGSCVLSGYGCAVVVPASAGRSRGAATHSTVSGALAISVCGPAGHATQSFQDVPNHMRSTSVCVCPTCASNNVIVVCRCSFRRLHRRFSVSSSISGGCERVSRHGSLVKEPIPHSRLASKACAWVCALRSAWISVQVSECAGVVGGPAR